MEKKSIELELCELFGSVDESTILKVQMYIHDLIEQVQGPVTPGSAPESVSAPVQVPMSVPMPMPRFIDGHRKYIQDFIEQVLQVPTSPVPVTVPKPMQVRMQVQVPVQVPVPVLVQVPVQGQVSVPDQVPIDQVQVQVPAPVLVPVPVQKPTSMPRFLNGQEIESKNKKKDFFADGFGKIGIMTNIILQAGRDGGDPRAFNVIMKSDIRHLYLTLMNIILKILVLNMTGSPQDFEQMKVYVRLRADKQSLQKELCSLRQKIDASDKTAKHVLPMSIMGMFQQLNLNLCIKQQYEEKLLLFHKLEALEANLKLMLTPEQVLVLESLACNDAMIKNITCLRDSLEREIGRRVQKRKEIIEAQQKFVEDLAVRVSSMQLHNGPKKQHVHRFVARKRKVIGH